MVGASNQSVPEMAIECHWSLVKRKSNVKQKTRLVGTYNRVKPMKKRRQLAFWSKGRADGISQGLTSCSVDLCISAQLLAQSNYSNPSPAARPKPQSAKPMVTRTLVPCLQLMLLGMVSSALHLGKKRVESVGHHGVSVKPSYWSKKGRNLIEIEVMFQFGDVSGNLW